MASGGWAGAAAVVGERRRPLGYTAPGSDAQVGGRACRANRARRSFTSVRTEDDRVGSVEVLIYQYLNLVRAVHDPWRPGRHPACPVAQGLQPNKSPCADHPVCQFCQGLPLRVPTLPRDATSGARHAVVLECPRITSTDLDNLICKIHWGAKIRAVFRNECFWVVGVGLAHAAGRLEGIPSQGAS
jgi:hypothetical protein